MALHEVQNLIKMAETFEQQGHDEQAATLFAVAAKLVEAAEEESKEEKGTRQMSAKAKAKFRAVKKAAESLVAADLDYRGPYKSACRKVEILCEDIIEAIKDCDLD